MSKIDEALLSEVLNKKLSKGSHGSFEDGMCIMEAVSYIAHEPWSDNPQCVCPVISSFLRAWNDALPNDERNHLLKPLIPRVLNTRGSQSLEYRRALMAADWLVRVNTPAWLRLAGLTIHADALSSLPEITSMDQVPSIKGVIDAARLDAVAAWAASWTASWTASWDAAKTTAKTTARDAAWVAAGSAAWVDARDTARDAARAASWAAAWTKLATVKDELQQSALVLVERMIAMTEDIRP